MAENRNTRIEKETAEFLKILGFSTNISGYEYLKFAIKYCVAGNGMERVKREKIIAYVANNFKTKEHMVDYAITQAIENTWDIIPLEMQEKYFGNTVSGERGKPTNLEFIAMAVRIIKNQFLEEKLFKLLNEIGMPTHIKGRYYLEVAIIYYATYKKGNGKKCKMMAELYNHVAEKFNTKVSNVEKLIRHAIKIAWERAEYETLEKIFAGKIKGNKATNSEFIAILAEIMEQNE